MAMTTLEGSKKEKKPPSRTFAGQEIKIILDQYRDPDIECSQCLHAGAAKTNLWVSNINQSFIYYCYSCGIFFNPNVSQPL